MAAQHDLKRFVEAQDGRDGPGTIYARALAELRAGRKETHWMWFVFPQLGGLGSSFMAQKYAIHGMEEARAFLDHPVLGRRMRECVAALNAVEGRSANQIMGFPDDLKLQSSLTLFACAADDKAVFLAALERYFDGAFDPASLQILGQ